MMNRERTEIPALKSVPTYLTLRLHRAYFFAGILLTSIGLAQLIFTDRGWSDSISLMMGALFLVSSYMKRIELRFILGMGAVAFVGAFFYELYSETIGHFGWKDLRRPALVIMYFFVFSLLTWWANKRQVKTREAESNSS